MQRNHVRQHSSSFLFLYGVLALTFLVTACGNSSSSATPTAQQLISQGQVAINKVTSYHFNLATQNPGTGAKAGINVQSADGDILVPDKLQANANAVFAGFTVPVKIIAIDDKQYYTDPITGKWTPTTGLLDPRVLSNSQTGVAALLGQIKNPSAPTASTVDGTDCWSINGQLATSNLAGITGGGTPAGTTVATTICIGKSDSRPYLIQITGIAVQGDTSKTVRIFKFSKFNETLSIVAPV
jgi:LppX_LprAFG lipoprotein